MQAQLEYRSSHLQYISLPGLAVYVCRQGILQILLNHLRCRIIPKGMNHLLELHARLLMLN